MRDKAERENEVLDVTDEPSVYIHKCQKCGRGTNNVTGGLCPRCFADWCRNHDEPPPYHCKHCADLAKVDTGDNPDTQGQYFCIRCGDDFFINEPPITRDDVIMMTYLGQTNNLWLDEVVKHCPDCYKPTATTADMPFVREVCTCKQEETLVDAFGPRPERPQRKPPPHWAQVAQEPWSSWGAESDEFQRQLQRYGEAGRDVQRLGADWQKLTQCPLDWNDKKAVKSWSSGLWTCLKAAGGDASIVLDATRKAIEGELSIANPYSVLKMTQALVGERRRGRPKPKVTPMMDQRGLDKPNPLARR